MEWILYGLCSRLSHGPESARIDANDACNYWIPKSWHILTAEPAGRSGPDITPAILYMAWFRAYNRQITSFSFMCVYIREYISTIPQLIWYCTIPYRIFCTHFWICLFENINLPWLVRNRLPHWNGRYACNDDAHFAARSFLVLRQSQIVLFTQKKQILGYDHSGGGHSCAAIRFQFRAVCLLCFGCVLLSVCCV